MAEKTFKLKWKDCLGRDWMNRYSLEACLFSKEHIKAGGLTVEEVGKDKPGQTFHLGQHAPYPVSEQTGREPEERIPWWRRFFSGLRG